ncbi:MAG TPA: ABC transporter ATP-binding protein [Candidatus Binatia bacterium]|nr:ABC transporter ATP-binding protein [Candidatus Binatia bacterium]
MSATPERPAPEGAREGARERRLINKARARGKDRERKPIEDPSAPIITRRLTKRYGSLVAVDSLDLEVHAGEIFGLLGQNGAGKTTTILMLLGLTEPSGGGARVVGLDPTRRPLEVKRRVGYLPDTVGFYDGMTGRENLRYTARLNGLEGREAEMKIGEVLEQVGMTDRADTKVETYSRGMLQRLGIADALVKDPSVLILDEPTAAIDPIGVIEILDMLRGLVRDRGIAILLSSHLLAQVQSVCDRVGIFAAGRLIGLGTVPELAEQFGEDTTHLEVGFDDAAGSARDAIAERLGKIPDVEEVRRPARAGEPFVLVTRPATARAVRDETLRTAAEHRLGLSSIREVVPSLDDIYRRAVRQAGLSLRRAAA